MTNIIIGAVITIVVVTLVLVALLLVIKAKLTPSGTVKIDINDGKNDTGASSSTTKVLGSGALTPNVLGSAPLRTASAFLTQATVLPMT